MFGVQVINGSDGYSRGRIPSLHGCESLKTQTLS